MADQHIPLSHPAEEVCAKPVACRDPSEAYGPLCLYDRAVECCSKLLNPTGAWIGLAQGISMDFQFMRGLKKFGMHVASYINRFSVWSGVKE